MSEVEIGGTMSTFEVRRRECWRNESNKVIICLCSTLHQRNSSKLPPTQQLAMVK
ncbi:hypothetical protein [Sutcliffiella horikoshii]|uniref:hypothetical protein n=1 Tax=Sutcliffiella horikoshii TaxID=79883 RepID=UPI0012F88990|nr:hypothetical protein [Sutcliffiella horikoshii]